VSTLGKRRRSDEDEGEDEDEDEEAGARLSPVDGAED
jgi:hypothetical protein